MLSGMGERQATIRVDVDLDGELLQGSISAGGDCERRFSSWLGLVAALDVLVVGLRHERLQGLAAGEPEGMPTQPAARVDRTPRKGAAHAV